MFIDSHCHLNFPNLVGQIDSLLENMQANQVRHALCVCVKLEEFAEIVALSAKYPQLFASIGVHPDYPDVQEPTVQDLVDGCQQAKVVAIGETGLDYCRHVQQAWQQRRFRTHIQAAIEAQKPLIVHTRSASEDTLNILREESAAKIGGVMHCFTESEAFAEAAMELGFYISFSGIVTFKKAEAVKKVVQQIPLTRILIETDSPYLAPVPHRGKVNQPAWVVHVAEEIARLKGVDIKEVAAASTQNFAKLFSLPQVLQPSSS